MIHSVLKFVQFVTLNVALNSNNNALLTLLISNNFMELKVRPPRVCVPQGRRVSPAGAAGSHPCSSATTKRICSRLHAQVSSARRRGCGACGPALTARAAAADVVERFVLLLFLLLAGIQNVTSDYQTVGGFLEIAVRAAAAAIALWRRALLTSRTAPRAWCAAAS